MKEELLKIVQMLHIGKMIDDMIAKGISGGLDKDAIVEIAKNNVEIKGMITASFQLGVQAFKAKAESDGKFDWKDSLATLLDMSDELIAEVIGEFVEDLLNKDEPSTEK